MAIHLHNDTPGQWDGTFSVLVRALIDDILSDGETFKATLSFDDGVERFERSGSVSRREAGYVVIDGNLLSEDDITGIRVD